MSSIALIAGNGALPRLLADTIAEGGDPTIYALEGQVPEMPYPITPFRVEKLGSVIAEMKERGVKSVCFGGGISRPQLDPAAVDEATAPLLSRLVDAAEKGDDGALRTVLEIFEESGITVRAIDKILPDLFPPKGKHTRTKPEDRHEADADRGNAVIAALGAVDVGQACVVADGQVLAVEAAPGTDAMLASLVDRPAHLPKGGILVKAPKPGQERRVDLPTIGAETVRNAAAAGLEGLVIAANGVQVLDGAATIAAADKAGMFIWVRR